MSEIVRLRHAVASLCDALKRIEWALEGKVDEGLLDECKKRRQRAEQDIEGR